MAAGESYEVTNTREVAEEMGISGVTMEHLFTFFYEDGRCSSLCGVYIYICMCTSAVVILCVCVFAIILRVNCWGDAWECEYEGPIHMQKVGILPTFPFRSASLLCLCCVHVVSMLSVSIWRVM